MHERKHAIKTGAKQFLKQAKTLDGIDGDVVYNMLAALWGNKVHALAALNKTIDPRFRKPKRKLSSSQKKSIEHGLKRFYKQAKKAGLTRIDHQDVRNLLLLATHDRLPTMHDYDRVNAILGTTAATPTPAVAPAATKEDELRYPTPGPAAPATTAATPPVSPLKSPSPRAPGMDDTAYIAQLEKSIQDLIQENNQLEGLYLARRDEVDKLNEQIEKLRTSGAHERIHELELELQNLSSSCQPDASVQARIADMQKQINSVAAERDQFAAAAERHKTNEAQHLQSYTEATAKITELTATIAKMTEERNGLLTKLNEKEVDITAYITENAQNLKLVGGRQLVDEAWNHYNALKANGSTEPDAFAQAQALFEKKRCKAAAPFEAKTVLVAGEDDDWDWGNETINPAKDKAGPGIFASIFGGVKEEEPPAPFIDAMGGITPSDRNQAAPASGGGGGSTSATAGANMYDQSGVPAQTKQKTRRRTEAERLAQEAANFQPKDTKRRSSKNKASFFSSRMPLMALYNDYDDDDSSVVSFSTTTDSDWSI